MYELISENWLSFFGNHHCVIYRVIVRYVAPSILRRPGGGGGGAGRQSALADASIPGHGTGKGPGGYKLFGGGKLAFQSQMTP